MPPSAKIYLPLEVAIIAAAEQNFDRDVRYGLIAAISWPQNQQRYLTQAAVTLGLHQENDTPHYPDHPHIAVEKRIKPRDCQAVAHMCLRTMNRWYDDLKVAQFVGVQHPHPKPNIALFWHE